MATEETISSVGGIVGIVILVVIVLGVLGYAFLYSGTFSWENLAKFAPDLNIPINQEELSNLMTIDTFEGEEVYSEGGTDNNFVTPTHVACSIATAIRDDFSKNGDERMKRAETFPEDYQLLTPIGSFYTIIKSGTFSILHDSSWKIMGIDKISETTKNRLKEMCTDTSELKDCKEEGINEACITQILGTLNYSNTQTKLCDWNGAYDQKKNKMLFGNTCGNADCGCSVEMDKKMLNKITQFTPSVEENSGVPYQLRSILNTKPQPPPDERFVIYWNRNKWDLWGNAPGFYRVETYSIPIETSVTGPDQVVELTKSMFDYKSRSSLAGAKYADLRAKGILKFTMGEGQNKIVGEFVNELKEALKSRNHDAVTTLDENDKFIGKCKSGSDGCLRDQRIAESIGTKGTYLNLLVESFHGGDFTEEKIKFLEEHQSIPRLDPVNNENDLKNSVIASRYIPHFATTRKVYIKVPSADFLNGNFESKKTYKITIYDWASPTRIDIDIPKDCGDPKAHCWAVGPFDPSNSKYKDTLEYKHSCESPAWEGIPVPLPVWCKGKIQGEHYKFVKTLDKTIEIEEIESEAS